MYKKWACFLAVMILAAGCGAKTESDNPTEIEEVKEENLEEIPQEQEVVVEEVKITDKLISFDERKIHIPQLDRDYEIWFLADSHIIVEDGSEDGQTSAYAAERKPNFTNETGYSSDVIFSQFIDKANEKKPDLILFGGDIIDFPSKANVALLKNELERLNVPYMMTYGNHDWTFPWEYMTEQGSATYRPMLTDSMTGNFTTEDTTDVQKNTRSLYGNDYATVLELNDLVVVSVDNSSNQVAPEALEAVNQAYMSGKPMILLQHVPFSTEELIIRAKEDWTNPVSLGMQVHGGIAPNDVSKSLWDMTHDDESLIKAVLAGHVHFAYEENLSESTVEIITDAAFKGKATKIFLQKNKEHQYFCDNFMLTADDKQYDLTEIVPDLSSVSELYPIADEQLYILGRVDENNNALMIYDFTKEEFVFAEHGTTMCWVQGKFETVRYLKDNMVYDLEGNIIYMPDESNIISMIEYVVEDFKVTVTDTNHENPQEIWIE